jgi:hypothetical protein
MKARGEVNLEPLVEEGLLLPYEKPLLDGRPAKAMVVWSWCVTATSYFDGLCCVGWLRLWINIAVRWPLVAWLNMGREGRTLWRNDFETVKSYMHTLNT